MIDHKVTTSGYAGYWTASCECGWVGVAHRSKGAFNAEPKAKEEGRRHIHAENPDTYNLPS